MGFALALAGGVLVGFHSYLYDLVFAIPLLLTVLASPCVAEVAEVGGGDFRVAGVIPGPCPRRAFPDRCTSCCRDFWC